MKKVIPAVMLVVALVLFASCAQNVNDAADIKAICTASLEIDAEPYGETPASLLAMAKGRASSSR